MRQWLFGVVAREFVYKGFRRADLNQLVEAVGEPDRRLANQFPNTQALALALIDEILGAFIEDYSERSGTEKDPYQRLTIFFIGCSRISCEQPAVGTGDHQRDARHRPASA